MLLPFYSMTAMQAANLNQATLGRQHLLEPRLVVAGPQAGKYVLGTRVATDPNFADLAALFAVLSIVPIDTDIAWPPEEEG